MDFELIPNFLLALFQICSCLIFVIINFSNLSVPNLLHLQNFVCLDLQISLHPLNHLFVLPTVLFPFIDLELHLPILLLQLLVLVHNFYVSLILIKFSLFLLLELLLI